MRVAPASLNVLPMAQPAMTMKKAWRFCAGAGAAGAPRKAGSGHSISTV